MIPLHGHALVVAEVEGGVEMLDEGVGGAAADRRERHGDADFEMRAEAAVCRERRPVGLAVDEEDRLALVHTDQRQRLRARSALGVALEVVADPARLGEGVGIGAVNVDEPGVVVEDVRALRLEEEEAVAEQVLISNGKRSQDGVGLVSLLAGGGQRQYANHRERRERVQEAPSH